MKTCINKTFNSIGDETRSYLDRDMNDISIIISKEGTKFWYKNNLQHRINGPAIICKNGTKQWHIEGKLHRLDGPAISYSNGTKRWYKEGKLHRLDGPAKMDCRFNTKTQKNDINNIIEEYYIEGKLYSENEYWFRINVSYR